MVEGALEMHYRRLAKYWHCPQAHWYKSPDGDVTPMVSREVNDALPSRGGASKLAQPGLRPPFRFTLAKAAEPGHLGAVRF